MAKHLSELLKHLGDLPDTDAELGRALAPEMVALALDGESVAKRNATRRPNVRSGRLRQSIKAEWDGPALLLRLRAGGRNRGRQVRYAAAQDRGAVVVPRRRKYLAIPLRAAKTAAGVPRYVTARRDPTEMFVSPTRRGGSDLLLRDVRTGEPRYLLTKGPITVRATNFLGSAADHMAREVPQALTRALGRLFDGPG